jgi:hypothetical protein
MPLRRALLVCTLAVLFAAPLSAQNGPTGLLGETTIPNSGFLKFPRVAANADEVQFAFNANRLDASLVARPAGSDAFAAVERLGTADGQPDYSTATVTTAPDGRLLYVWINQAQRAVLARVRASDGAWEPTRTVRAGEPFPVYVAAAASATELFAVWRNPDRPMVFSRSRDGGATWSAPVALSTKVGVNAPAIAAGADGTAAVAFTQGYGDNLQIYAGAWNGRTFEVTRISAAGADFADPGVAVLSNGRVVVGFRGVAESGPNAGLFFAERAADGSWPVARLVGGKVTGPVSVAADESGGMGLFWVGAAAGRSQVWFAHLPRGGSWASPVGASAVGDGTIFNVHGALAVGADGRRYGHAASEFFVGSKTFGRAYRFAAGAAAEGSSVAATPIIENDTPYTRAEQLSITFQSVVGTPAELRWRWGAPPTDVDSWQPFAPTFSVKAPATGETCAPQTLFTQVRAANLAPSRVASDTITLDRAVQATLTPLGTSGAPGFTNQPTALLAVDGTADCSGLAQARSAASGETLALSEPRFTLAVPVAAEEGAQSLGVELTDTLGNSATLSATVVYDRTPPVVEPGAALAVAADAGATLLQTLRLHGVRYTDASGAQPWALAVAVSGPHSAEDAPAQWRIYPLPLGAVEAVADGSLGVVLELSLADLLPRDQLTPGRFGYRVRLVDHAGNLSAAELSAELTLDKVTYPRVALPLIRR